MAVICGAASIFFCAYYEYSATSSSDVYPLQLSAPTSERCTLVGYAIGITRLQGIRPSKPWYHSPKALIGLM